MKRIFDRNVSRSSATLVKNFIIESNPTFTSSFKVQTSFPILNKSIDLVGKTMKDKSLKKLEYT